MSELSRLLDTYIHNGLAATYTALPALVTKVNTKDGAIQSLNCRPALQGIYRDGVTYQYPEIYEVPVLFPSAGGGIISFPVQVDDTVLLIFSMKDLDNFLQGDFNSPPSTQRYHNLTDAIAITGLYPTSNNLNPSSEDVEIKYAGSKVVIASNGEMTLEAPSVNIKGTLNVEGDISSVGSVSNNGFDIGSTHTHISPATGTPTGAAGNQPIPT